MPEFKIRVIGSKQHNNTRFSKKIFLFKILTGKSIKVQSEKRIDNSIIEEVSRLFNGLQSATLTVNEKQLKFVCRGFPQSSNHLIEIRESLLRLDEKL